MDDLDNFYAGIRVAIILNTMGYAYFEFYPTLNMTEY